MQHHFYKLSSTYKVAILASQRSFRVEQLTKHYVDYFDSNGVSRDDIILFDLTYDSATKVTATTN